MRGLMLGQLNKMQIDDVLRHQMVGRIGCFANNKVYVVPISYAYDGKYIYAHSREGTKIEMMRMNPNVCFEVDVMENMANWRGVIIWGKFEEIKTRKEQEAGMKLLSERFAPILSSETTEHHSMRAPHVVEKAKKSIVYRIAISERTGRFEKSN